MNRPSVHIEALRYWQAMGSRLPARACCVKALLGWLDHLEQLEDRPATPTPPTGVQDGSSSLYRISAGGYR